MSWHRLDDDFDDNDKQLALGDAAFRLWVCSWSFCARQRPKTGCMTETQALALARKLGKTPKHIKELVDAGRWERTDDGYAVHDFGEHVEKGSQERVAKHRANKGSGNGSVASEKPPGNVTSPPDDGYGNATSRATGLPIPEPVPDVPNGTPGPAPAPQPPKGLQPLPLPLPAEVLKRVDVLTAGCEGILARSLEALERDLVLSWASTLRRAGELVPVAEILGVVHREMSRETPEGGLPVSLAWCRAAVATLARERNPAPVESAEDWRQHSWSLQAEGGQA